MKRPNTPKGFLNLDSIDHFGPHFQYIVACHNAMWELIRLVAKGASGNVWDWVESLTEESVDEKDTD